MALAAPPTAAPNVRSGSQARLPRTRPHCRRADPITDARRAAPTTRPLVHSPMRAAAGRITGAYPDGSRVALESIDTIDELNRSTAPRRRSLRLRGRLASHLGNAHRGLKCCGRTSPVPNAQTMVSPGQKDDAACRSSNGRRHRLRRGSASCHAVLPATAFPTMDDGPVFTAQSHMWARSGLPLTELPHFCSAARPTPSRPLAASDRSPRSR